MNYVVGRVGFRGATVGGDVAGAGALQDTDVAILEPGTGVLAEDEVTGLKIGC